MGRRERGVGEGEGVWRWGKRDIIFTYRYTVTTTISDSCIKMGSD